MIARMELLIGRVAAFCLLVAVSLAFGCGRAGQLKELPPVSITLERTACYGYCPVYTVTIHENGLVEYTGKLHIDVPGLQKASANPDSFKGLLKAFETIHFTRLNESYLGPCE